MSPNVFATTTINVTDTVEKPVAMIAASFTVYLPSLNTLLVINRPIE